MVYCVYQAVHHGEMIYHDLNKRFTKELSRITRVITRVGMTKMASLTLKFKWSLFEISSLRHWIHFNTVLCFSLSKNRDEFFFRLEHTPCGYTNMWICQTVTTKSCKSFKPSSSRRNTSRHTSTSRVILIGRKLFFRDTRWYFVHAIL